MTQAWLKQVAQSALGDLETLEATYDIARSLLDRSITGDFVECGVYAGAHCAVMAQAIIDFYDEILQITFDGQIHVHLFDSFRGLPAASPMYDQELFAHHGAKLGEAACSIEGVKSNMKRWGIPEELLLYHPGWFHETVPSSEIEQIALLRLDGDLYSSTKACLPLFDHVVRGGWVICDDFNLSGCRKAILERLVPAPIYWRIPTK